LDWENFGGEQIGIMAEETREAPVEKAEKAEKPGIKIASVIAAALAAITAALLGSTLGVAGTVLGAGVASVVTTVGGEVYLRSLQRTREAAQRAKALAVLGARRAGVKELDPEIVEEEAEEAKSRWKPRWPLIIGTSLVAFVIAIVAITSFEGATGNAFGGGEGTTIGKIVGGDNGNAPANVPTTPTTSESTPSDTQSAPSTTAPVTSTTTVTAPPSTPTTPPTTTTPPSTTTTAPPATTGTPTPTGSSPSGAN
jgi:cell division septation protein DedD